MIAARKVLDAGLRPLVLEADERVGGRILTEEVTPGVPIELGAQWIGDTHERMFRLAAELGVETYPSTTRVRRPMTWAAQVCCAGTNFAARFAEELAQVERVLRQTRRVGGQSSGRSTVAGTAGRRMGRDHRGRLV